MPISAASCSLFILATRIAPTFVQLILCRSVSRLTSWVWLQRRCSRCSSLSTLIETTQAHSPNTYLPLTGGSLGLPAPKSRFAKSRSLIRHYYAKHVPSDGGTYLVDHTRFTYLMDRDGKYLGFFPPGTSADRMIET